MARGKTIRLTDNNFAKTVMVSDVPVLVDFWAPWCPPCHTLEPSIRRVARDYQGRLRVAKLRVDEHAEVCAMLGVISIPCLMMFNGGRPVDRLDGAVPHTRIVAVLERHVAPASRDEGL